jgi:hypothetical protein
MVSFSKTGSQSIRGGRRNQSSRSLDLGANDPRIRRQPQAATTDMDLALPFAVDTQGRIYLKLDGALYVTPDGKLALNVANGLKSAPGSPMSIQIHPGDDSLVIQSDGTVVARPGSGDVANESHVSGSTVSDALDALSGGFPAQLGYSM